MHEFNAEQSDYVIHKFCCVYWFILSRQQNNDELMQIWKDAVAVLWTIVVWYILILICSICRQPINGTCASAHHINFWLLVVQSCMIDLGCFLSLTSFRYVCWHTIGIRDRFLHSHRWRKQSVVFRPSIFGQDAHFIFWHLARQTV